MPASEKEIESWGFLEDAESHLRKAQKRFSSHLKVLLRPLISRYQSSVDSWHRVVMEFSDLKLTKSTDSLPALSGLAKRMEPLLGHYIAGLWAQSLPYHMAWRVEFTSRGAAPFGGYRGPSWSWVAVSTKVWHWEVADTSPLSILSRIGEDLPPEFYSKRSFFEPPQEDHAEKDDGSESSAYSSDEDGHDGRNWIFQPGSRFHDSFDGEPDYYRVPFDCSRELNRLIAKPLEKPSPVFSVLTCQLERSPMNSYGEVSFACLQVAGLTRSAKLIISSLSAKEEKSQQSQLEMEFGPDPLGTPADYPVLTLPFMPTMTWQVTPAAPTKFHQTARCFSFCCSKTLPLC